MPYVLPAEIVVEEGSLARDGHMTSLGQGPSDVEPLRPPRVCTTGDEESIVSGLGLHTVAVWLLMGTGVLHVLECGVDCWSAC